MKETFIRELKNTKRKGIQELIYFLEETDFFIAPASTKFHGNYEGGLAEHSLNVFHTLHHLDAWLRTNLPFDTIAICGLLHDVCKIETYKKTPEGYKKNDTYPIGHGEKTIIILKDFIKLTETETILIRWHMGNYTPEIPLYRKYLEEHHPYYKLLYFADDISSSFLEGREKWN